MADQAVPDLTSAGTLDGTELLHVVQSSNSRKVLLSSVWAGAYPSITGNSEKVLAVNSGETGLEWVDQSGGVDAFIDLGDTPLSYTGYAGYVPVVDGTETGLIFQSFSATLPSYSSGDENKILAVNGTYDGVEWIAQNTLVDLVPSMSGNDGKVLAVASGESSVEWITLADLVPSMSGNDGKVLAVASGEASVEWVAQSGGSGGSDITITEETASFGLTNTHLGGGQYIEANSTSAIVVTVTASLTGTEPVTVERSNTGTVTFAEDSGVTINSPDGNLAIGTRYASATLIPKGSDVYVLQGDLA